MRTFIIALIFLLPVLIFAGTTTKDSTPVVNATYTVGDWIVVDSIPDSTQIADSCCHKWQIIDGFDTVKNTLAIDTVLKSQIGIFRQRQFRICSFCVLKQKRLIETAYRKQKIVSASEADTRRKQLNKKDKNNKSDSN